MTVLCYHSNVSTVNIMEFNTQDEVTMSLTVWDKPYFMSIKGMVIGVQ